MVVEKAMVDTNVYQWLLEGKVGRLERLIEEGKLVVFGCKIVRDELRNIPLDYTFEGKSLRNLLITTYDSLVGKRSFPVGSEIEALAEEYYCEYGGNISKKDILSDFKIVATATIHRLDIIISEDERTMKSNYALAAYTKVNSTKMYPTPKLIRLSEI